MIKLIGSILILASCTGIGFSKSKEMQFHLTELEELKRIFYLLKSELQYTRATFAEVFEKIEPKIREPFRSWLYNLCARLNEKSGSMFWEIWNDSIEEHLKECRLKEDELNELKIAGKNLEYIESLDLFIEQMEYRIKNTRENYRTKRKLCQSLGIMGGIFLVILLL